MVFLFSFKYLAVRVLIQTIPFAIELRTGFVVIVEEIRMVGKEKWIAESECVHLCCWYVVCFLHIGKMLAFMPSCFIHESYDVPLFMFHFELSHTSMPKNEWKQIDYSKSFYVEKKNPTKFIPNEKKKYHHSFSIQHRFVVWLNEQAIQMGGAVKSYGEERKRNRKKLYKVQFEVNAVCTHKKENKKKLTYTIA